MKKQSILFFSCTVIFFNLLHSTEELPTKQQEESTLIATLALANANQALALSQTSRTILHLFYITQHLDPALVFIKKTITGSEKAEEQCAHHIAAFFSGTSILKSEKIKNVFSHIAQTHSLLPLLQVWDHIKQFKYGIHPEEQSILLDFSKLCLITYQSLLTILNHKNASPIPCITPEDLDSLEQIDQVFETMEKCSLFYFLRKSAGSGGSPMVNIPSSCQALCINDFCASFALRFYLNKRLKNAFCLFNSFHQKKVPLFMHGIEYLGFKKGDIIFDDQVIAGYFDLLQEEKRLDPLMQLVGQFQSFDFIKSPTFIKEFLVLLCITYKDLLLRDAITSRSTETIKELHELSLEQLLSLIDTITEKYGQTTLSTHAKHSLSVVRKNNNNQNNFSVSALIENEYGVSPDAFTHLVFHRYYYVKRLEEVVKTLLKLTTQSHTRSLATGKTSLLLKPLAMVWKDFAAYKDVCDQQLIDDFTKEIFILSQTLLHNPLSTHYAQVLQAFLAKKEPSALQKSLSKEQFTLMSDFKPSIEVDKVISRFYLIKRLEPIIAKIYSLHERNLLHLGCTSATTGADPCLQHLNIYKKPIISMIHDIYQTHSFKPVFNLWNGISRYKYIEDEEICSEFARFITHLLHSTTTHLAETRCKDIFIEGKGFLPLDQLHEMPLEEILNLLDVLIEELPVFLKENEIGSGMYWKDWLKKYWLIAPLRAAIFGITVYMMYKGMLEKPEHHHTVTPANPV